jgi:hypothetical protein
MLWALVTFFVFTLHQWHFGLVCLLSLRFYFTSRKVFLNYILKYFLKYSHVPVFQFSLGTQLCACQEIFFSNIALPLVPSNSEWRFCCHCSFISLTVFSVVSHQLPAVPSVASDLWGLGFLLISQVPPAPGACQLGSWLLASSAAQKFHLPTPLRGLHLFCLKHSAPIPASLLPAQNLPATKITHVTHLLLEVLADVP